LRTPLLPSRTPVPPCCPPEPSEPAEELLVSVQRERKSHDNPEQRTEIGFGRERFIRRTISHGSCPAVTGGAVSSRRVKPRP
jgi:hypothetical protein